MEPFVFRLGQELEKGRITHKIYQQVKGFYEEFEKTLTPVGLFNENCIGNFHIFLDLIIEQLIDPYQFEPYHQRIRSPFNYHHFGLDFVKPLIDLSHSSVLNKYNVTRIADQINKGENVVLLANHQTEVDPQIIYLLLEEEFFNLVEKMIFVAGDRVVSDPVAIPFSKGCNLLCIYSKKHIENPPERKVEKQLHNQKTMKLMSQLLSEGGKCIYVAPSGGRDRINQEGVVEVSKFDPNSVEMFRLMASTAEKPTHFYTLALFTYDIMPPPHTVQKELGEERRAKRQAAHLAFGDEVDLNQFPGSEIKDKHQKREAVANYIWSIVKRDYDRLTP